MTFKEIMTELQAGKYRPMYLLMGEEPYFIDKITDFIQKNALPKKQQDFNQIVMYGKDVTTAIIDNTAKRFPMMSERLVVIVKEAQNVKNIENLSYYAEKPLKSTVLVLNLKGKKIQKTSKLYKAIDKNGVVLESSILYENKIPGWIIEYLKEKGFTITPDTTRILVENLGNNLEKISNELDKLILNLAPGKQITPLEIEQNIGISKDFNIFELQNAILNKDVVKVNLISNYLTGKENSGSLPMILNSLYSFFSKILLVHGLSEKTEQSVARELKINAFFAKDYLKGAARFNIAKLAYIFSQLRVYDLKSKGVDNASMDENGLLKELMFKIMH